MSNLAIASAAAALRFYADLTAARISIETVQPTQAQWHTLADMASTAARHVREALPAETHLLEALTQIVADATGRFTIVRRTVV